MKHLSALLICMISFATCKPTAQTSEKTDLSSYYPSKETHIKGFVKKMLEIMDGDTNYIYEHNILKNDTLYYTVYDDHFNIYSIGKMEISDSGRQLLEFNRFDGGAKVLRAQNLKSKFQPYLLSKGAEYVTEYDFIFTTGISSSARLIRSLKDFQAFELDNKNIDCIRYTGPYILRMKDELGNVVNTAEYEKEELYAKGLGLVAYKMSGSGLRYYAKIIDTLSIKTFDSIRFSHDSNFSLPLLLSGQFFKNSNCKWQYESMSVFSNENFTISYPSEWNLENKSSTYLSISSDLFSDGRDRGFILSVLPYQEKLMIENPYQNYFRFTKTKFNGRRSIFFTRNDTYPKPNEGTVYWRNEIRIYDQVKDLVYILNFGKRADLISEPDWCEFEQIIKSLEIN